MRAALRRAWSAGTVVRGREWLRTPAAQLRMGHPWAASSIAENLEETLTLIAPGVFGSLQQTLRSTNPIENLQGTVRRIRRTDRLRDYLTAPQTVTRVATVMSGNSRFPVAVHVLTALAYRDGESLSSSRLAASVRTNPVVIRRLLIRLAKGGLIEAQVGKSGGVQLARRPESITLLDVFRAVEGGSPFVLPDKPENKACEVSCAMRKLLSSVLAETDRAIARSLEKVRLSDLVKGVSAATRVTD